MKILSITAGAAGMYCGSCLRDNALAAELIAQGHDVVLLPLYTPTLTDEPNVSADKVFFGGISVYLEQSSALFRGMPRFVVVAGSLPHRPVLLGMRREVRPLSSRQKIVVMHCSAPAGFLPVPSVAGPSACV